MNEDLYIMKGCIFCKDGICRIISDASTALNTTDAREYFVKLYNQNGNKLKIKSLKVVNIYEEEKVNKTKVYDFNRIASGLI